MSGFASQAGGGAGPSQLGSWAPQLAICRLQARQSTRLDAQRASMMYSLITTTKMNGIDRKAWLANILADTQDRRIDAVELVRAAERNGTLRGMTTQ